MNDLQERLQAALGAGYRIERELGGGGMSRVFVATEVELARKVVVKVLPPDMAAGLNAERFRREIQLSAQLQHPHIVPLIAAGRNGDLVWYTMPLIEGESLRARLAREGELPISDTVRILRDVSDALAYAHSHGVVHRDIKPDNVLISGRHAVVTDFGVAKAVSESTGESSLTSIGVALGTPSYMAPEQAVADPHVDHRADIYATGVMAYELLTGHPPFEGQPQAVLAAHVTQAPDAITRKRAAVPPALETVLMRCLEKKPADRWQTAAELHQQLELMATPSGGAQPTTATAPIPRGPSIKKKLIVLIPVISAVAAAVAGVFVLSGKPRAEKPAALRLDPNVVAVLPFRVAGADPSLHYLRQGMVDLLQTKLTGEGGPRAADARSVLAAFRDAGGTDNDDVAQDGMEKIARRVGAARVLQGSIVGPADHVVISAQLVAIPGGQQQAQATVEGHKDSLFVLVDRLATQLLALGAGANAQQLSALSTTNSEAMRAYLDGIVAYRRGSFGTATARLTHAVQLDSTFALALSALIEANGWSPVTGLPMGEVRRLGWKYRDRLSQRDERFLSIRLGSLYPRYTPWDIRIRDREELTRLMPESAEAWYLYGDGLFHYGALADALNVMERSRVAFEQSVRLDSLFNAPLTHLSTLSYQQGDLAATRRWAPRVLALDSISGTALNNRWEMAAASRDDKVIQGFLKSVSPGRSAIFLVFYPRDSVTIAYHQAIAELVRKEQGLPNDRGNAFRLLHLTAINHGRPAEARRWLDSAFAADPSGTVPYARESLVGALVWGEDTSGLGASLLEATGREAQLPRAAVELAQGRADSAERLVIQLRTDPAWRDTVSEIHLRGAALLEAWAAGIRKDPSLSRKVAVADSFSRGRTGSDEVTSFVLARLHEQAGEPAKALVALRRRQSILGDVAPEGLATMLREEGRLAAKTGDRPAAIKAYLTFLWWYGDPEPSRIPRRDSVRAELAALQKP